jgi:glycosyltransferase involved in cell wall biosynthesis
LHCLPKLPFEELRILTASADVGLSLDKSGHGNYEMSLPNKLFDFMHAGLPMVTTARAEVAKVVEGHGLGVVVPDLEPETLRQAILEVLSVPKKEWSSRAGDARNQYHWGVDEPKLFKVLDESLKAHLRGSQKA